CVSGPLPWHITDYHCLSPRQPCWTSQCDPVLGCVKASLSHRPHVCVCVCVCVCVWCVCLCVERVCVCPSPHSHRIPFRTASLLFLSPPPSLPHSLPRSFVLSLSPSLSLSLSLSLSVYCSVLLYLSLS